MPNTIIEMICGTYVMEYSYYKNTIKKYGNFKESIKFRIIIGLEYSNKNLIPNGSLKNE